MAKTIQELPAATSVADTDVLVMDDGTNTRKVAKSVLLSDVALMKNGAPNHNSIYRGKDITSMYDSGAFHTNVANGSFEDIYLGDYIVKNGRKYVVAACDEFYGYSNKAMITTHHCAMICVSGLPNSKMNETNTNTGGYQGSYMHTTHLPTCLTTIEGDLGSDYLVAHSKLLDTGDSWSWVDNSKIALLSENQVYGSRVWGKTQYSVGEAYNKLAIFNLIRPNAVFGNKYLWLRDSWSSTGFAFLYNVGIASNGNASSSFCVCPLILLK